MPEARLREESGGLTPDGPGWFIVNVGDALAYQHEIAGWYTPFESRDHLFEEVGFGIHILQPGRPCAKYHREHAQEGFLVLHGECLALIEGEERPMKAWDFLHCPPGTDHVLVGAGDGPCVVVMFGRRPGRPFHFPACEAAARYDAQAPEPTDDQATAYSDWPGELRPGKLPWPPG
jgi:uncharacterized cupin superfamily protein